MKKKLFYLGTIIIFVLINLAVTSDINTYTEHYPFNRLMVGDTFFYPLSPQNSMMGYGCRIVKIGPHQVDEDTIVETLLKTEMKQGLPFTCVEGQDKDRGSFTRIPEKSNIGWLFMLLLLIGNVCWIWGLVVGTLHTRSYQAYLYFLFSCGFGLFMLLLVDVFSMRRLVPLFVAAVAVTVIVLLRISFNLANRRMGKTGLSLSILFSGLFVLAYILHLMNNIKFFQFVLLVLILFICGVVLSSAVTLGYAIITGNRYLRRRNLAIMVVMVSGVMLPAVLLMMGLLFPYNMTP